MTALALIIDVKNCDRNDIESCQVPAQLTLCGISESRIFFIFAKAARYDKINHSFFFLSDLPRTTSYNIWPSKTSPALNQDNIRTKSCLNGSKTDLDLFILCLNWVQTIRKSPTFMQAYIKLIQMDEV